MSPDAETAAAAAQTAAVAQESAQRASIEIKKHLEKLQNLDGRLRRIEERLGMLEGQSPVSSVEVVTPDLQALTDRVFALETKKPSREVVTTQVETLPQEYVDQIERITKDLSAFKDSQEFVLPKAFAEAIQRIETLERRPVDITPATTTTVIEERLSGLATRLDAIEDNGDAASELYAGMAKLMRKLANVMRDVEKVKSRGDAQHEAVMQHLGSLAQTVLRSVA